MGAPSFLDSVGRGAGQGATFGANDELVAKILANMPGPDDRTGIPREYAAGSPEQDYLASERGDNARAAAAHPVAYQAAEVAGGLPSAMAIPAGAELGAAGRIAAGGLKGGALGALSGAGHADGSDALQAAGKGAALGGALGGGSAAAIESLPYVRAAMSQIGQEAEPALATAGGQQVNQARAGILPPRPNTGDMPREQFVPKAGKPMNAKSLNGERATDHVAERPTTPEAVDPKRAYRDAAHRNRQAPPARGPQPTGDDTRPTVSIPPPQKFNYKNAPSAALAPTVPAPSPFAQTMPAPPAPLGRPTIPAAAPAGSPSMYPTLPAPAPEELRPTMPDLGPVRPTLKPGTEQAYKDAVMREIAESARRNSY